MSHAIKTMTSSFAWIGVCVAMVCMASTASAEDSVNRAPVNDYAGVIPEPVEAHVGKRLRAHYDKTGVQMAVIVVDSTGEMPIEDRRSRLEVGYGLEAVIPDSMAVSILAGLRPVPFSRSCWRLCPLPAFVSEV